MFCKRHKTFGVFGAIFALTICGTAFGKNGNAFGHNNSINSLRVTSLEPLSFGMIAPHPQFTGRVIIAADQDSSSQCDQNLTCIISGDRARYRITGRRHQMISVDVSRQATLENQYGQYLTVEKLNTYASGFGQGRAFVLGRGAIELGVGATLVVMPNQSSGAYTGEFEISISYE